MSRNTVKNGECIGVVVPSVSPRQLKISVYRKLLAEGTPLLGRLVKIEAVRNKQPALMVALITGFSNTNPLAVEPYSVNNEVDISGGGVFGLQEQVILDCEVISVFQKEGDGYYRVPPDITCLTGSKVYFLKNDEDFFKHVEDRLFFMGYSIDKNLRIPFYLQGFDVLGESYHTVIVGTTGSGKTTEAKKLLLGYAKHCPGMNFLILDPQGEFARSFRNEVPEFDTFPMKLGELFAQYGQNVEVYGLENIKFIDLKDFKEILCSNIDFMSLDVRSVQNRERAVRYMYDAVERAFSRFRNRRALTSIPEEEALKRFWEDLALLGREDVFHLLVGGIDEFARVVYTDSSRREEVATALSNPEVVDKLYKSWKETIKWFVLNEGDTYLKNVVKNAVIKKNRTIVVDLSSMTWEEPLKCLIVLRLLEELYSLAGWLYRHVEVQNNIRKNNANLLFVLDEAHRIVPASNVEELNERRKEIKRNVIIMLREFRKFGVGLTLVSTSASNLDKEVWSNTRVKILGYGLYTRSDIEYLKDFLGDGYSLYKNLMIDPTDPLMKEKEHRFVVHGPIVVLSRGYPDVYVSPSLKEFYTMNGLNEEGRPMTHENTVQRLQEELLS